MYVCRYVYASLCSIFIVCVYMLVKVSTEQWWNDTEKGNRSTWAAKYLYANPTRIHLTIKPVFRNSVKTSSLTTRGCQGAKCCMFCNISQLHTGYTTLLVPQL